MSIEEGLLLLGPAGKELVLVSIAADVRLRLETDWDEQRKQGANRSRPVFRGCKPAEIQVEFIVMPEDEEKFWDEVVPLIRPRTPRGRLEPLDATNLQMNRAGIRTVVLKGSRIGGYSARDGREVSIDLAEWQSAPVDPAAEEAARRRRAKPPGIDGKQMLSNAY